MENINKSPLMYGIIDSDGAAYIGENCVASSPQELFLELNGLNDSPDAGYKIVALGHVYIAPAAPQVVADERKGSPYPDYDRGFSNGWDACAKRAAAPVQAQEPVGGEIVHSDCRTADGITIGLVDGMIAMARVVAKSDLSSQGVKAALKDFSSDEDVHTLYALAQIVPDGAKPYAYEYGKSNCDGTFSIVIERGEVEQTSPGKYEYGQPKNISKEFPVKGLFAAPVQPVAVPDSTLLASVTELAHKWNADAVKDGFAASDAGMELLEILGWPVAAPAAQGDKK